MAKQEPSFHGDFEEYVVVYMNKNTEHPKEAIFTDYNTAQTFANAVVSEGGFAQLYA